ncbi:unnamed protein product [Ceratitis capitata]|uniref:(Mediterranean fruit fly) hypothetical protein n=1 Tax=Ceratitis capitata TaxID=7213 RepID=A0A811UHF2_CERCA|nr:unnamed protein product [Ceratitis capitata]
MVTMVGENVVAIIDTGVTKSFVNEEGEETGHRKNDTCKEERRQRSGRSSGEVWERSTPQRVTYSLRPRRWSGTGEGLPRKGQHGVDPTTSSFVLLLWDSLCFSSGSRHRNLTSINKLIN